MSDDKFDALVERIMKEGEETLDAFEEGRRCGAFFAGIRSGALDMRDELSVSAAVALTETWMVGGALFDDEEPEPE